jgi:2-dehydro-3-deoxyglucarate aldolase
VPESLPGSLRQRLLAGEVLLGSMVTLDAPAIVETLCHLGCDWLFIETEHAPLLPDAVQHIIQIAGATPCLVRLSRGDEISIKRALDAGAAGIIVPQVNSAAHARLIVSYAKYPPFGSRGIGMSRASLYGQQLDSYVARANAETAVVVQAEHVDAVEDIEAICAVEGVDAVFVGPYDLAASLHKTGRVDDPEVLAAIATVRNACLAHGVRLGYFGGSAAAVAPRLAEGYTLVCCGADIGIFAQGARQLLAELRGFGAKT